ncbi:MAG: 5-formyltetrahydrofolate cyclo-ligase [Deltaproteobacteria bacterium]|uniref:5-formyltetrahydrofolate cyclo-ligase n=1 Tax=Candidatus Zymogenus saltonus TaxID=2844893 RepID=A0A9D8KAU8_9DELT|nr:5-formyltetrahydrofolate cyclo-ligase [Candidatus Zymogenus saltonus]
MIQKVDLKNLDKADLRISILKERECLDNREVARKSEIICRKLIETPFFEDAVYLGLYSPVRNEVKTDNIFDFAKGLGKRVGFPITSKSIGRLLFFEVEALEELSVGTFGINEPPSLKKSFISLDKIDLLIIPGVVFDERGHRVGYGGGYYDRLTGENDLRAVKAALAFDMQIVENLPAEPHDKKVDYIITESRMIKCL